MLASRGDTGPVPDLHTTCCPHLSRSRAANSPTLPCPRQIRPDRQTLLWSATWPKEVQAIAKDFLKNPYQVGGAAAAAAA